MFWAMAGLYYVQSNAKLSANSMASLIQNQLSKTEAEANSLLNNSAFMSRLWSNSLSEQDLFFLASQKYIIQLYINGKLEYWNSNSYPVSEMHFIPKWKTIIENKNTFLYKSLGNANYKQRRINIIIPIFNHHDVTNEYLKSGFSASEHIPNTSKVSISKLPKSHQIKSLDGNEQFYVQIDTNNIEPLQPDLWLIALTLAALLSSVLALQLFSIYLSRLYSPYLGVGLVAFLLLVGQLIIYYFGLPFGFENLSVFSPLVFASNKILPSFGHLFLHVLSIYWLLSIALAQVKKNFKRNLFRFSSFTRWGILILEICTFLLLVFYLIFLMQSIVYDSDISFDTNNFNAADKFTFFALIIITVISRIMFLKLQLSNIIISKTIELSLKNYSIVFVISLVAFIFYQQIFKVYHLFPEYDIRFKLLDLFAVFWGVAFLYNLSNKRFQNFLPKEGLFSMIFVSVYFSLLFALYFKFYIDDKERNILRISFAEKLSRQQDAGLERDFSEIVQSIAQDKVIKDWLQYSDTLTENEVLKHLRVKNTDLFYNNFDQRIALYNDKNFSVLNSSGLLIDSFLKIRSQSIPTMNERLFFRLDKNQQGAYLAFIPIIEDTSNKLLGNLIIDFQLKQNITQSVYPRLLKSQDATNRVNNNVYDYAVYNNGKLVNQSGTYNFDYAISGSLANDAKVYKEDNEYSELAFKASPTNTYVVLYKNNKLFGVITIFSFLFGIFLLLSSIENWISILSSAWIKDVRVYSFYNNSMSLRIKYFVLGFTGISFLVIGLSTVLFLKNKYQVSSMQNIEEHTINLSESIEDYLHNQTNSSFSNEMESEFDNKDFIYFLTNIAQQQKIDLNLFNVNGKLMFSTQENLYKASVLSDYMSYEAKHTMSRKKLSTYLHPDKIGTLDYTSSYAPIFNSQNTFIGYINIPFFFTKEKLDSQIISLITTLINIYTILILISSLITFLFINNLTKSLTLVADKLKNVNLKNNEQIYWPYKDEIGLLVGEYNKMIATVEKNARSLVLDERQNAWREMAQQVAHEIKNPLTPMKLNIQYLQQAINSNHPDIINLTKRVSSSIIEQIDNLNYIASEFSNFAKMPENKTERIDLKAMLENIVLLFSGNKNLKITHLLPPEQVVVFADKSQMLRIFTNIVQNAVEALDTENKMGLVNIELLVNPIAQMVTIKVSDNGSGIPDEVKDRIFDPYFTTKSSGTGLGLAMSKKIIDLSGGTIRFESTKDVGTTFFLTIPMG